MSFDLREIGRIESPLTDIAGAPKQGAEGGAEGWIVLQDSLTDAARDLKVGDRILVLTWLHLADRSTLVVHPRDDESNPLTGVFSTRSADRPNPIGIHEVQVLHVADGRIRVAPIEVVDGTPVVDMKPVL
jgi:tRNA-Thr(GGU) m(6)t(6)A37 methyltransferase TsaA